MCIENRKGHGMNRRWEVAWVILVFRVSLGPKLCLHWLCYLVNLFTLLIPPKSKENRKGHGMDRRWEVAWAILVLRVSLGLKVHLPSFVFCPVRLYHPNYQDTTSGTFKTFTSIELISTTLWYQHSIHWCGTFNLHCSECLISTTSQGKVVYVMWYF